MTESNDGGAFVSVYRSVRKRDFPKYSMPVEAVGVRSRMWIA